MQRKLLVAACMLLILGAINCEIPQGTACRNSNPFIKLIEKAKIGLYQKPMISTSDVCDFEFEKYGSCCNPNQLKDYAHKDSSEILEIAKKLGTEYKNFQGMIPRIFKRIKQIALAPLHPKDQALNNRIQAAHLFLVIMRTSQGRDIFEIFEKGNEYFDDFEEKNKKCWEMQAKARQVATCYACSGRSAHFFRSDKALISRATCSKFVDLCQDPLSNLVKFIRVFSFFKFINISLKSFGIKLNIDSKVNQEEIKSYFKIFEDEKISQLIGSVKKHHTPELQSLMCAKFLRLGEVPIIKQMQGIFRSDDPWKLESPEIDAYLKDNRVVIATKLKEFNSKYSTKFNGEDAEHPEEAPQSNWKLSRLLQFSALSLISDSKIIDPTDPSYKSVGVTGNSPMELSRYFP